MPKKKPEEKESKPPSPLEEIVAELTELRPRLLAVKDTDRAEYLRLNKRYTWLVEERDRLAKP